MVKKADVQVTEVTHENIREVLDFFEELFASGNVVESVFGYSDDGVDICIDIETGDVEVTHSDGSVEKISSTDPRVKTYWDRF